MENIKDRLPIIIVLLIGLFLRLDKLDILMPFIGDQGWFYLAARDMIQNGSIPLVGITSSHTWLHQGPFWTYMLALVLPLFNYNPVGGAYLTVIMGTLSIVLIYRIGRDFFSEKIGFIAALLLATSPLVIIHDRLAYHTSPIPFFVLLLIYSLLSFVKGNKIYLPISILTMSILYNFELATVVLWVPLVILVGLGLYKKEKWSRFISDKRLLVISIVALIIPMTPVLVYDLHNGFPQTVKYGGWFVYKILQFFGIYASSSSENLVSVISFFLSRYRFLISAPSYMLSIIILVLSIFQITQDARKKIVSNVGILFLFTTIPLVAVILSGTSSEAYLPMLFPGLILFAAYLFATLLNTKLRVVAVGILIFIIASNVFFIYVNDYMAGRAGGFGKPLSKRLEASKKIIRFVGDKDFKLVYDGEGGEHASSTMNFEYLVWYLSGRSPRVDAERVIHISETTTEILIRKSPNK